MRQGNNIGAMLMETEAMTVADNAIEFCYWHDLRYREFTHRQNQLRFQELYFRCQPFTTVSNFITVGHPVTTPGIFTGKTSTHCRHINLAAKFLFFQTNAGKPAKQGFACCPGKRPVHFNFPVSRRLADQKYWRHHRLTGDRRTMHVSTAMTTS